MPECRVDQAAVRQVERLVDEDRFDDRTELSEAAPGAAAATDVIGQEGFDASAAWHPAEDPDASEGTEGRHAFPCGDFHTVNRAALIHAEQRASQNDHDAIEEAADDLLQRLDAQREG